MKIVALEEHFGTAEVMEAWKHVDPRWRDDAFKPSSEEARSRKGFQVLRDRLMRWSAACFFIPKPRDVWEQAVTGRSSTCRFRSVGIDLGKTTFHLVALGDAGKVLVKRKFSRSSCLRLPLTCRPL